jgi:hypothetical protein
MDTQSPSPQPATKPPFSPAFRARLIREMAAAAPPAAGEEQPSRDEKLRDMAELFDAFDPRDAAEAQLAAFAVAAIQAGMDSLTRAARPGMSDDTVTRLRTSAFAAGRTYAAILRMRRRVVRPEPAAAKPKPKTETQPRVTPADGHSSTGERHTHSHPMAAAAPVNAASSRTVPAQPRATELAGTVRNEATKHEPAVLEETG